MNDIEETTIGDLSEQIAAWEHDESVSEVTSRQRKLVYNSLQQTHLPKLADRNVVDYDKRKGTVEFSSCAEEMDPYLDGESGRRATWSRIYLLIAGVAGLLAVGVYLDVAPVTFVEPSTWLLILSGTLLACATVQYRHTRLDRNGSTDEPPELGHQKS